MFLKLYHCPALYAYLLLRYPKMHAVSTTTKLSFIIKLYKILDVI